MGDDKRTFARDVRGRFTTIDVERDVLAPGLGVPREYAYDLTPRHAPEADTLAGPPYGPLQARRATLTEGGSERMIYIVGDVDATAPGELAATRRYGIQGRQGREAARRSADPMDPSRYLTGADDGR